MSTLTAVAPVVVMLVMGMVMRMTGFLSRKCIDDLKTLVAMVMLTVTVFHALATADFSMSTLQMVLVMLVIDVVPFLIGFAISPLFPEKRRRYIPFLMSMYEGGMLVYPLYANMCGADRLSNVAILDISGVLFGFGVWMNMLAAQECGEPMSVRGTVRKALSSPTFIAAVLGLFCGLTGIVKWLLHTSAGPLYQGVESIITAPMSALILLAVGYDLDLRPAKIKEVLQPIGARFVIQAFAFIAGVMAVKRLFPGDTAMLAAVMLYISAPSGFSTAAYIKDPEGGSYVATTNSLYVIITIVMYAVATYVYERA